MDKKHFSDWKAKDLLKLPARQWDTKSTYDSILLVNSREKHDSGFMLIAIIGVNGSVPEEIASYCDDVNWCVDKPMTGYSFDIPNLRTDMLYPSGIVRIWSNDTRFCVGESLSSTTITTVKTTK